MTNPVVLYGTQSNGETLPVQVDATGRLVAEGLQGPPGEPGQPGEPGPPGPNELLPYGEEGTVLTIVDGVPAWASPGPPPPSDLATLIDNYGADVPGAINYGLRNNDGSISPQTSDWDATMRALDCWTNPTSAERGLACNQKSGGNQDRLAMPFQLDLIGGFGMVLEIHCAAQIGQNNPPTADATFSITTTAENVIPISTTQSAAEWIWTTKATFSFLVNRADLGVCDFELEGIAPTSGFLYSVPYVSLQKYELVDATTYLKRAVLRQKLISDLLPNS